LDVLLITLPIFSLIGLGWGGVKLGLFDADAGAGLSRFVFWFAFPALLLSAMAKAPAPDSAMIDQIGIWLGVLLAFQLLGHCSAKLMGLDKQARAAVAMASSCANTAFLGTAVLVSLMGPSILPAAAAFVAVENIVVVSIAVAGLKLAKNDDLGVLAILKTAATGLANPTSVGATIGFVISLSGHPLPMPLARPIEMLGSAASPCGLVALGIVMATITAKLTHNWRATALVVILKCGLLPLAMWGAFSLAGAPQGIKLAACVFAACPSAVNVFIQARQADVWAQGAATAVFITTLVSIVGVSLVAGLGQ
jgi:malonate transporter and related proteins